MNPFDALLVPPALVKRALDDLHDIAVLARRYTELEEDILARVEDLEQELILTRTGVQATSGEIAAVRAGVDSLNGEISAVRGGIETLNGEISTVRAGIETLNGEITAVREGVEALREEMAPLQHLEPIRRGIEPLEKSMAAVRESVNELEPMVAGLDREMRALDPKLDEMQESIEPIGDLAEKIPGNRRRRDG